MSPAKTQDVIQFGTDIELDLRAYELRRRGRTLKLERLPMDVLILLIERRGELVTREQIAERIWGKILCLDTDNSINGAIRKIRLVLNDDPDVPRFIQTVTGRGYRFIAPVTEPSKPDPVKESTPEEAQRASEEPSRAAAATAQNSRGMRGFALAALAAIGIAGAYWSWQLKQPGRLPFESVKTVRLTSMGKSAKAAISLDGRYIAHTMLAGGKESLLVRQARMLNDIEIVPPQSIRYLGLTFSNDGEMVYYVARSSGDQPGSLYRIGVMGGVPQKLKEHLDSPITFSPDGNKYAFVRELANESVLLIAEMDSGKEETLASRKLPEVLDYPAWSPDGRVIACSEYNATISSATGSNARIIEVSVRDRTERAVSRQTWGNIKKLAWLHDGKGLVMSAREPGESGLLHLWHVSYPEGFGRAITEGLNVQVEASVSADSHQIITVQKSTISSIWRTGAQSQDPELVMSGESGSSGPVWTQDGRIVFEEELQGQRSIWSVSPDGKNRRQFLPEGNSYDHSASAKAAKLAFISDRTGVPAIWTMDTDGGNLVMAATPSGEPASDGTAPQISPDGSWIAFTSVGGGHWTALWKVSSHGGKPIELNDKLWLRPAISPNGKWIAGFYDDRRLSTQTYPTSIAIIGSDGGPPTKIIPIPPSVLLSGGLRWSVDNRKLFYINRGMDGSNIWAQPLDGSAPYPVTRFQGIDLFSFDWSPDGKQLVFSRGAQASDVTLVEDAAQK